MTATETRTLRVAEYARESSDHAGDAHNVGDQLVVLDAACAARGWEVPAGRRFIDNDLSASSGKPRPRFNAMMRMVDARQLDVIVVRHMDRLVRRVAELESVITRCERAGVQIVTLAGELDLASPSGRLVGRMLASVAQHEVEIKAERQAMAAAQAAARGQARKAAPRPFGYEDDRTTRRPAEAAALEWAAGYLIRKGNVSGVCREWARRGLRPAQLPFGPVERGKAALAGWTRSSVVTIMTNPRNAGFMTYLSQADRKALAEAGQPRPQHAPVLADDDGQPVMGKWEPILTPQVWEAVVRRLADPDRKPSRKGRSGVRSLLGGLAVCPCGNVIAASHVSRLGYTAYRCQFATRGDRPGPHTSQRADAVDDHVRRVMIKRLSRDDLADLLTPHRADLGPLRIEAQNKRAALVRLGEDLDNGEIDRAEWRARRGKITARLAEIDTALNGADADSVLTPFTSGQPAAEVWDGLDDPQRRAVIGALTVVTVHPAGAGSRKFDPNTVTFSPVDG
jgi:DNA invertase Pin-like site-specific DNA recombinase